MKTTASRKRPKHLNLLKIHLPITGIASINHRISGVILFLAIPLSLYLLQLSVTSETGFRQSLEWLSSPWVKVALIPLVWAFVHHLFAGFRFLMIDQNFWVSLQDARKTAWVVVVAAILVTVIIAVGWLL